MNLIAGYKTLTPRRWNSITEHCYKRGGVCSGCEYQIQGEQCQAKGTTILSVKLFGKPEGIKRIEIIEE